MKLVFYDKKSLKRCAVVLGIFAICILSAYYICIMMPEKSYTGEILNSDDKLSCLVEELRSDVDMLSVKIGPRNFQYYDKLEDSVDYIVEEFRKSGYEPQIQEYLAEHGILSSFRGAPEKDTNIYKNIIAEKIGTELPGEIIVIGAHYDSVPFIRCPAANDNASGVAAVLAIARRFSQAKSRRTLRFVAFTNEEPPYFWTKSMGSYVYAKSCRDRNENIVGMITPETIGYYSDEEGSQRYPFPLSWIYPSKGNFIAFVGNIGSASFLKKCIGIFRKTTNFPSEGAALPGFIPGVGWSDHWSFWKHGYQAIMITDTALFRYKYYHTLDDTIDKISFDRMAIVVQGIAVLVEKIANE